MCKSALDGHVLHLHTLLDAPILVLDGSAAFPFSFILDLRPCVCVGSLPTSSITDFTLYGDMVM